MVECQSPLESPSSSSCASGVATSPMLVGCCRVCRKGIEVGEEHHYCGTCSRPVCEDCSSYYDREGEVSQTPAVQDYAPPASVSRIPLSIAKANSAPANTPTIDFLPQVWMCNVCRRRRGTFAAPQVEFLQKRRVSALVCPFPLLSSPNFSSCANN